MGISGPGLKFLFQIKILIIDELKQKLDLESNLIAWEFPRVP